MTGSQGRMSVMRFLVTGANGFVGRPLCAALAAGHGSVRAATRNMPIPGMDTCVVGSIGSGTDWGTALARVDVVLHLAARVHVMHDDAADPLAAFVETNVHGTLALARQAADAGVQRFVYVSSIKVNGENSRPGMPFNESDPADPQDPYGVSKWQAEQGLYEVMRETGMELVVVRPPLVYGPGVKANFAALLDRVARGYPLPFKGISNQRSMIYVGNLVDMLVRCATDPAAAGETWLVADETPVSSNELVMAMADALGVPSRSFFLPLSVMRGLGKLLGKSSAIDRLTQSLVVDTTKVQRQLGWTPRYTLSQGLQATAKWYWRDRRSERP